MKGMKRRALTGLVLAISVMLFAGLCGCGRTNENQTDGQGQDADTQEEAQTEAVQEEEAPQGTEGTAEAEETEELPEAEEQNGEAEKVSDPVIEETDWSGYFGELNGAAVVYRPSENHYQIYNSELAQTRRSPCSTFKIISSLKISPKEQTEVMERIFGDNSGYSEETKNELMRVMRVSDQDDAGISVYGKTGMGKDQGVTVDAWFTGFADTADDRIYFCVYLGETEGGNVTSTGAKEIALNILADYE